LLVGLCNITYTELEHVYGTEVPIRRTAGTFALRVFEPEFGNKAVSQAGKILCFYLCIRIDM